MRKKKVVDPHHAKNKEYRKVIKTIAEKGKCPFCKDNFLYHKGKVIKRNDDWFLIENGWPYENAERHFLIISNLHKESLQEVSAQEWESLKSMIDWTEKEYDIKGAALAVRFGNTKYTGATVCHIHFHLIAPHQSKVVIFPIG